MYDSVEDSNLPNKKVYLLESIRVKLFLNKKSITPLMYISEIYISISDGLG
jgi:hypothetical protein